MVAPASRCPGGRSWLRPPDLVKEPTPVGLVLAAGSASRFGGVKILAPLAGRPLLQHVLDAAVAAGIHQCVVVLGQAADDVERAISWHGERRVRNPTPEVGLSSSVKLGIATVETEFPEAQAIIVLLADQPTVSPDVIRALIEASRRAQQPIVIPRYEGDGSLNPVLLGRAAWSLVQAVHGDRGLGPIFAARPDLVAEVPVRGANPDVDTPADLEVLSG